MSPSVTEEEDRTSGREAEKGLDFEEKEGESQTEETWRREITAIW